MLRAKARRLDGFEVLGLRAMAQDDPFRDALAAAHARIGELERRKSETSRSN